MSLQHVDTQYQQLFDYIVETGSKRETRSATCYGSFDYKLKFDLRTSIPFITKKKLALRPLIGELIWFLNGENTISQLKARTFGDPNSDKKTIWTPDFERWSKTEAYRNYIAKSGDEPDSLGLIYGIQWYNQLHKAIDTIMNNHTDPRIMVNAWNVDDIQDMALPPCHYAYQFYCDGDYLDLKWHQRSVDIGLGLPFNIASYAVLLYLVAFYTGKKARFLIGDLGDVHIYENSIFSLMDQFKKPGYKELVMSQSLFNEKLCKCMGITQRSQIGDVKTFFNSLDVEDILKIFANYKSEETIKIDVQVG